MYGHMRADAIGPAYPQFFARGEGARIWDIDGNEYVDLMCSWGPIVLGHRHPRVEAAIAGRRAEGDCLDGPSEAFVELAETFVAAVPHADWAMFAKNGTDATSLAVRLARAESGRDTVLVAAGAYHGVASWCANNTVGITADERADKAFFEYNDLASVEAAAAANEGDVAAIVVCPMRHDLRRDLELVDPEFARGLRRICDRTGAALVLDDVRCGMRIDLGGSWEPLGVRPDLSAWSKAIANGSPLAAVLGAERYRDAANEIFTTGSFWMGASSMAAALATFETLREEDGIAAMERAGRRLCAGLAAQAADHQQEVRITGPPQMPLLMFAADGAGLERGGAWADACVENGAFLHPFHNWFLSAAHADADIDRALEATEVAFATVREHFGPA